VWAVLTIQIALFLYLCTPMPYCIGDRIYLWLSADMSQYQTSLFSIVVASTSLAYFLDIEGWRSLYVKTAVIGMIVSLALTFLLTLTRTKAAMPMMVFVVVGTFSTVPLRNLFKEQQFFNTASTSLLLNGLVVLFLWLFWLSTIGSESENCANNHLWHHYTRDFLYPKYKCPFQIEVISISSESPIKYIPCTFDIGCVLDNNRTVSASFLQNTSVILNVAPFCNLRSRQMLTKVAELLKNNTETIDKVVDDEYVFLLDKVTKVPQTRLRIRYNGCFSVFIQWISPFMCSMLCIWYACSLSLVSLNPCRQALLLQSSGREDWAAQIAENEAQQITEKAKRIAKYLSRVFLVVLVVLWTTAGINGSDMGFSNVVIATSGVAIVLLVVSATFIIGLHELWIGLCNSNIRKKVKWIVGSDWGKAFGVWTIGPLIVLFVYAEKFKCKIQMYRLIPGHRAVPNYGSHVTMWASSWNWTNVAHKTVILGVAYMTVNVIINKFTFILFSVINNWVAGQNMTLLAVTMLFMAIGILMFLNPAIPGVPVYVSGGIMLVAAMKNDFNFWISILYTWCICLLLKLTAVVFQQKIIGEKFGSYVSIRKFISVNSNAVKSLRIILEEPGLTVNKVLVLCGGPDWPTSVTTGILKLNVFQMLLGTLPVAFLILPCVISGAFLLRVDEDPIWSSLSTLAIGISFVIQMGSMLAAAHAIESVASRETEKMGMIPIDDEVHRYTLSKRHIKVARLHASSWQNVPWPCKLLSIGSIAIIIISTDLSFFLGSLCFKDFQIQSSVEVALDGNAMNIVIYPFGYVSIGLIALSFALDLINRMYFRFATNRILKTVTPSNHVGSHSKLIHLGGVKF